jgi:hypothetical protein
MNRGQRRAQWLANHRTALRRDSMRAHDSASASPNVRAAGYANLPRFSASSMQLRIGELLLHGFPASARHRIGEATQQELMRLLTERGVPPGMNEPFDTARVDAGSFQMMKSTRPNMIGALVAGAVYGGLRQ